MTLSEELLSSTHSNLETLEAEYVAALRKRPDSASKAELFAVWLDRFRAATKPLMTALKDARQS